MEGGLEKWLALKREKADHEPRNLGASARRKRQTDYKKDFTLPGAPGKEQSRANTLALASESGARLLT